MHTPLLLNLPWPPTVNTYWRHVGPRVLISEKGRKYRKLCGQIALAAGVRSPFECFIGVHIDAYPPDRRKRDIDNLFKAPLDAMTRAQVWVDDSQIDELTIHRCRVEPGGRLVVQIIPIPEAR